MALGATRAQVLAVVVKEGLVLVATGLAMELPARSWRRVH
jgi:hypothetical protein